MPRIKKASAEAGAAVQEVKAPAPKRQAKAPIDKTLVVQYGGSEWNAADLEEKAIEAYVAEGHQRGRVKKLTVYVKPEEQKIYHVINDKITGSTDLA